MRRIISTLCLLLMGSTLAEGDAAVIVIPRAPAAPVIDGKLDDACWTTAVGVKNFTVPGKDSAPAKNVAAQLCCDAQNLYIAVTCSEPEPAKIKALATLRNEDVWKDDCVEVWIRTGNEKLNMFQFIANSIGTQEELRKVDGKRVPYKPAWEVKPFKADASWGVELKIPAADLELKEFARGRMLSLKLGREDYAGAKPAFAVWPPKAPYAGMEGLARAYIEDDNVVVAPAMEDRKRWYVEKQDEALFQSLDDAGQRAIRINSPNRYCTAGQNFTLAPDSHYLMTAEVKASGPMTIRVRAKQADPKAESKFDIAARAGGDYVSYSRKFKTGPTGEAMVILGVNEQSGNGAMFVRNLKIVNVPPPAAAGSAIPVKAGDEPLVVTKLAVTDCRSVRGFITAPVDGTLKSGQWDGGTWEYNQPHGGAGVCYEYNGNDGLHIAFADNEGFDALVVRGGVKAKLYRDCAKYDDARSGTLVSEFPGQTQSTRALYKERVKTGKVSFFEVGDGYISDCSFFRIGKQLGKWEVEKLLLQGEFAEVWDRIPNQDAYIFTVAEGQVGQVTPKGINPVAFMAECKADAGIAAIGLEFKVEATGTNIPFTIRVMDPLNPRLELHGADYELDQQGRVRLVMDFPDQVLVKDPRLLLNGARLWIVVQFDEPVTLVSPKVELYTIPREQAAVEALAHRKLLLRGFYSVMSEARPWNGWNKQEAIDAFWKKETPYTAQVREIVDTLEECRAIDKDGKDDVVRQYYNWMYRGPIRFNPIPFDVKYDRIDGVPEWAVLLRQSWLQAREVPKWWIENRMTPNGELGGEVGDDTDMLGNYGPFPMFERDGAGGMVLDLAARLSKTAQSHLVEGINKHTTDSLHAYEEGLNLDAQMPYWFYGDPVYVERCMVSARSLGKLTMVLPNGHRHFRSIDEMGAVDLRMERKPTVDGDCNVLMWHPALEAAAYNRNPAVVKLLKEYADTWLSHHEKGKYATKIDVSKDKVMATSPEPFSCIWGGEASFYMMLADITGETKYIQPMQDYINSIDPEKGAAGHIRLHIPELTQMEMLGVSDDRKKYCHGVKWNAELYASGGKEGFIKALKTDIEELQRFKHMYTTVECFTDRVFLYPLINPSIAYTGGYTTRNKFNRNYAVSWDGFGTDYAALVTSATKSHLKVLLCNVSDKPISGRGRLWRLEHGEYDMTLGPDADGDDKADKTETSSKQTIMRGTEVELTLPPKAVQVLELKQTKKLDDILDRADLALSPLELKVEGGKLSTIVHNIGVKDADESVVVLIDAQGKTVQQKPLAKLAAPLDLVPKTVAVEFDGLPADVKGWAIVVDPQNKIWEIYEGNNKLSLKEQIQAFIR